MFRSIFLVVALALAPSVVLAQEAQKPRRPNIILILSDDYGYECVGANGGASYQTPNLDKLAAGGMRFEHCYVQPLCTPTRVQLMTGIYNVRNYVRFGLLDKQQTTFAQLFKKAGYATGIAGKWQLGQGFDLPGHFGFDDYCLWQLNRRPSRYGNPGLEITGKAVDFTKGEYGPDIVSDHALDFIARKKDGPFLLYYPLMLTHDPFEPTPDSPDYKPAQSLKAGYANPRYFADMVAYQDKLIGKLVAKLDQLGLRENTLLIFTGDNGTGTPITSKLGDQTVKGGKGQTTDAGMRVPLIANWPGHVPDGKVCRDLVDSTDFLPTICAAAGIAVPAELKIDGQSFWPQLLGEKGAPREWIYCWYARDGGAAASKEFARTLRYKLYRDGSLYDVPADRLEARPLDVTKLDREGQAAREMLRGVLDRFQEARPLALRK